MQMIFGENILSWLIFSPLIFSAILFLLPRGSDDLARWIGLAGSLLVFALSLVVFLDFRSAEPGYQFLVDREWLPIIGARYVLGIDEIGRAHV